MIVEAEGKQYDLPDGTTPEGVNSFLKQIHGGGGAKKTEASEDFSIPGEVKKVTSRIWEGGIAQPLGLPVDIANSVLYHIGVIPEQDKPVLGSEWLKDKMRSYGLSEADSIPETRLGKLAAAVGEGGMSSVIGGAITGSAAEAAGIAAGSPSLAKAGQIVAQPKANLIAGTAGAAGGEVARQGGEAAGLKGGALKAAEIGGELLGGAAGGFSEATRIRAPKAPDPVLAAYERLNLAPTVAETARSGGMFGRASQWLEGNLLPQTLGGGGVMEGFRQRRQNQLTALQQDLADQLGGVKPREEMGKAIQDNVRDTWTNIREADGKLIGNLTAKYGRDRVYAQDLVNAVTNPVGTANVSSEVRAATLDPIVQDAAELIRGNAGNFTFADLAALKQKYGRAMEPGFEKNVNDAQVSQIFNAVRSDMESHVKASSASDFKMMQESRRRYAMAQDDFRRHFKKLVGSKDVPVSSERAYEILTAAASEKARGNMEDFRHVWDALPPSERGNLSATVLARLGSKDTNNPGNPETWELSRFLTGYRNLSDEAKSMLFSSKPQVRSHLDDFVTVTENMQQKLMKLASTSKSGVGAIAFGNTGILGLLGGLIGNFSGGHFLYAALAGMGGPWLMAQVLTNPTAVKGLTTTMRGLDRAIDSVVRSQVDLNLIPKIQQGLK